MRTLAPLVAVALLCTACPDDAPLPEPEELATPARPAATGSVVVLTDTDADIALAALGLLEASDPDLDVRLEAVPTDQLADPGRVAAVDVVLAHGTGPAEALRAAGALGTLPSAVLERVTPRFRGPDARYVGLSVRGRVIVAKRLLANRPLSVLDLGEGRWHGRVARTSALHPTFVEHIAATLGDHGEGRTQRFLGGLRSNSEGLVKATQADALRAVAAREASLAWVDLQDFHRHVFAEFDSAMSAKAAEQAVAESNVEVLYPDRTEKGVPWSATVGAVTAGTSNADGAAAVLHALLSDEGQRAWAWPRREHPAVEGLPGPPGTAAPEFTWSTSGFEARAELRADALALADAMEAPAPPDDGASPDPPGAPETTAPGASHGTPEQAASP